MSRTRKSLLFCLVLIPVLAGGFVFQERDSQQGARLLDQVLNIVSTRFVDTVDQATLYEKAARGLVHELNDPYSVLLSPKELSTFNAQTNGRYAGIGMEIAETQGFITVQRVFPHTPAEQAGVQEGDRSLPLRSTRMGHRDDRICLRKWDDPTHPELLRQAEPCDLRLGPGVASSPHSSLSSSSTRSQQASSSSSAARSATTDNRERLFHRHQK